MHRVIWDDNAIDELAALPDATSARIVKKVENYLALEPYELGKRLSGRYSGYFRYRIGDYRIIYEVQDDVLVVYVFRVGHRKDVYDQ